MCDVADAAVGVPPTRHSKKSLPKFSHPFFFKKSPIWVRERVRCAPYIQDTFFIKMPFQSAIFWPKCQFTKKSPLNPSKNGNIIEPHYIFTIFHYFSNMPKIKIAFKSKGKFHFYICLHELLSRTHIFQHRCQFPYRREF